MSIWRLVLSNVRGLWPRYLSLFVLGVLAVTAVATSRLLLGAAETAMTSQVSQSVTQRAISVESNREAGGHILDLVTLGTLRSVPGVASVEPTYPVAVDLQLPDVAIGLDLVPLRPSMPPPLVRSVRDAVFPLGTREIVLPSSIDGRDMSAQLGQTITVGHPEGMGQGSSTSVTERVVVVALSDPAWQDDGPRSAFGNARDVEAWFALSAKPLSMEEVLAQQGSTRQPSSRRPRPTSPPS